MRKVRKNNIGKKRKISKGGAMLYTAGIACLIALVGVVTIMNSQFINEYVELESIEQEQAKRLKEEKERLEDENNILLSNENILNELKENKEFLNKNLSISPPKDIIKVRF